MAQKSTETVAIIGSGIIGKNWALVFASAGYSVLLHDSEANRITEALNEIEQEIRTLAERNALRGNLSADEQLNLIKGEPELSKCVSSVKFVQECIPEVLSFKQQLYKQLDELITDDVIISSSTSTLLPSKLSENLRHKSQIIVSHPVAPPYFVPLVEIVPSPWTLSWVTEKTEQLMKRVGQVPVVLKKEIEGFALNRLQYAVLNQCWDLFTEGILDVESIDKVMSEGLGMRYAFLGPFETAHLNAGGFSDYSKRYAESMYAVCQTFKPAPKLSGKEADEINRQLCTRMPLDKLEEARERRNEFLMNLAKLKKTLPK